jgi:hypothetical protein
LADFKTKVAPRFQELMRYSSGISAPKRDIVVVKVLTRSQSHDQQ